MREVSAKVAVEAMTTAAAQAATRMRRKVTNRCGVHRLAMVLLLSTTLGALYRPTHPRVGEWRYMVHFTTNGGREKKKGAGEKGMFPPPYTGESWLGDALSGPRSL
ncbi:hypothetical protein GCM10008901_01880 [Bifidobacterium pullorum]